MVQTSAEKYRKGKLLDLGIAQPGSVDQGSTVQTDCAQGYELFMKIAINGCCVGMIIMVVDQQTNDDAISNDAMISTRPFLSDSQL